VDDATDRIDGVTRHRLDFFSRLLFLIFSRVALFLLSDIFLEVPGTG
jgi:hypothetical protein